MKRQRGVLRLARVVMWLVPGGMVLGVNSCGKDLRDGLVDAGVAFVSNTAADVLQALFPVADWVQAAQGGA